MMSMALRMNKRVMKARETMSRTMDDWLTSA